MLIVYVYACSGNNDGLVDDAVLDAPGCVAREYVFAFAGQSNMQGENTDHTQSPVPAAGVGREYLVATDEFRAIGPAVDDLQTGEWYKSLARAKTGSSIPAFVDSFSKRSGGSVAAISVSRGGAGIFYDLGLDSWQPQTMLMADATEKLDKGLAKLAAPLDGVVYLGGETDIAVAKGNGYNDEDFKQGLREMLRTFRTRYQTSVLLILPSHINPPETNGDAATLRVRSAIETVVAEPEFDYARIVFDDNLEFRSMGLVGADNVHYTQVGQNAIGAAVGDAVAAYIGCP